VRTDSLLVLVVDDDPAMVRALAGAVSAAGHRALSADTGLRALEAAALRPPDAILLDLGLPDLSGIEVCRRMRDWTSRPIIVVSGMGDDEWKIAALDAGADDYLTKPFSTGELLARLRAVLRRSTTGIEEEPVVCFGDVVIDLARRRILRSGHRVHLTPREYGLLAELARHAGRVRTHRALLGAVWGPRSAHETQYLRVYMASLRRKLELDPSRPRWLLTETGIGYRLAVDVHEGAPVLPLAHQTTAS
jgi:two-component system KDP operon response regulator KdpE